MTTPRIRFTLAAALLGATALAGIAVARRTGAAPVLPAPIAAAPVTFTGTLDRTAVLRGGDGIVRMELVMRGAPAPDAAAARRPTDFVVVLDRSGSMSGEKIAHARAAVRELVSRLGADDRFALVTYANTATLAIPLAPATANARAAWLATVGEVQPDGGTNMSAGLDVALDLIKHSRGSGRAARAILVSDGLANQGDDSRDGLLRRASRAAHGDYVLSTAGVGADFNESLMTALADAGTGNYYYLRADGEFGSVLTREFGAAQTTVASGVAVEIAPADGVRVVDAAGYPLEQAGAVVRFRPGTLFAGQERRVWVTLAVQHGNVGTQDVGRVTLAYADADGRATTLALADLPRVACVAGEDDFYANVDKDAWSRSTVVDSYNQMQADVAGEVRAGRRDAALERVRRFKEEAAAMNQRVQAPAVAAQLGVADRLERDVADAFDGENQDEKQNALSKTKSAEAVDGRRVGAKQ